jgi:AraC-like DNA-binding protein
VIALAYLPPSSLAQLRRAFPPPHGVHSFETWEELTRAVTAGGADVIVVDPCAGTGGNAGTARQPALGRVERLAVARLNTPGIPIVGYVSVTAIAIHAVHALVQTCGAEVVVRGLDDGADTFYALLQRIGAGSSARSLVGALGFPFSPLPADVAAGVELLFRRPDRVRSVTDLAKAAATTRRTLDRWLARAGLASARTLLVCARANAAFHLLAAGGMRPSRAAVLLGYPSPRALAREIHSVTGYPPSTIAKGADAEEFQAALRSRLFRPDHPAHASY